MRSILIALAAALAMLPMNGMAADYELVGFTSATFDGAQGIRSFTEACQAEFDTDTRMCNSVEVMETVNWPSLPANTAGWTRPVYVPNPSGTDTRDASGHTRSGDLSCASWIENDSGNRGLSTRTWDYLPGTSIGWASCDWLLPVACCAPAPGPSMATVPAIMWFGRGLLAAMVLSIAGAGLMYRRQLALPSGQREISKG